MLIFKNKQKGASAVEYAVLLVGVCLAIIVVVSGLGFTVRDSFQQAVEMIFDPPEEGKKCKDSDADKDCGIGND